MLALIRMVRVLTEASVVVALSLGLLFFSARLAGAARMKSDDRGGERRSMPLP